LAGAKLWYTRFPDGLTVVMAAGEQTPDAKVVRFGAFEVDLSSGELRKHGTRLRLQEQPFKVLATLLERRGEVVTREELVKLLWPDGTFVDYDRGLNAAISRLRQVLSDSAENPRFVETVARRGYRFIGPLEVADLPGAVAQPLSARAPARRWVWLAGSITAIALASFWWWRSGAGSVVIPLEPVPLTSYAGAELHPSFSPDGTQVAFSWNGEKQDNFDIYVKTVGSDPPRRLTFDPAVDDFPAWSPDGRYIAFQRGPPQGVVQDFYVVPPTGGTERKLISAVPRRNWATNPLAWSADGKHLAFARDRSVEEPAGIFLIAAEGSPARRLTTAAEPRIHGAPAFSPDGKFLAFATLEGEGAGTLSVLSLADGHNPSSSPRELVRRDRPILQIAWTKDARAVVFAELRQIGGSLLWKMSLSGRAQPEPLGLGQSPAGHTISPAANRIAYSHSLLGNREIWQPSKDGIVRSPLSSTFNDRNPQFSPDGRKVVFGSWRSGRPEIWVANADGSGATQLTRSRGSGSPRWSPDGRSVVYDTRDENGRWDVNVVDAAGGQPAQIVRHPADDFAPGFSRDGTWIYFASNRDKQNDIYRVPASGGDPVRITENGGAIAVESNDGKSLYYLKEHVVRGVPLFVRPLDGGPERKVIESVSSSNFAITDDGIYYASSAEEDRVSILVFDPKTGQSREVYSNLGPFYGTYSLTVSPAGKAILLGATAERAADLYLVENFR
jgi:Tol biopolymer transport system component/DNA-binding winged helix-turn-helix (wHTH) protein